MELFIFHEITKDPIIKALLSYKRTQSDSDYFVAVRGLISYADRRITDKNIIREYVLRVMLEQNNLPDITKLRNFLRQDIKAIYSELFDVDWDNLFKRNGLLPLSDINSSVVSTGLQSYSASLELMIDSNSNEALGGAILAHTESFGTGISSAYSSLVWNGKELEGVFSPDPIQFDELIGLTDEKRFIIANTESFMAGKPANDILLTGCSGTGKSACIKACVNLFKDSGLRLIEVKKEHLNSISDLISSLKNSVLKYIIFIDGLTDDMLELSFSAKGQTKDRNRNVLIYTTCSTNASNTQNLISSSFGTTLNFGFPTKEQFLKIIEFLLKSEGIDITEQILAEAVNKRENEIDFSGRAARQFVYGILSNR